MFLESGDDEGTGLDDLGVIINVVDDVCQSHGGMYLHGRLVELLARG